MRAYWAEYGPPANVVTQAIAAAVGVKFDGARSPSAQSAELPAQADPFAVQALIGQAEPLPYSAPQKGLTVKGSQP